MQFCSGSRCKPTAGSGSIEELVPLVVPEDQSVKIFGAGRVPADHELLTLVNPHLAPNPGAPAGLVPAVQPLCDDALEAVRPHGFYEVGKAGVQPGRLADRLPEPRQDLGLQYLSAHRK